MQYPGVSKILLTATEKISKIIIITSNNLFYSNILDIRIYLN